MVRSRTKGHGVRPLGRPIRRWVDNIKMDLAEIGRGGVDWIGLAHVWYKWRFLVNVECMGYRNTSRGPIECCTHSPAKNEPQT
jgi:hypothetical protein